MFPHRPVKCRCRYRLVRSFWAQGAHLTRTTRNQLYFNSPPRHGKLPPMEVSCPQRPFRCSPATSPSTMSHAAPVMPPTAEVSGTTAGRCQHNVECVFGTNCFQWHPTAHGLYRHRNVCSFFQWQARQRDFSQSSPQPWNTGADSWRHLSPRTRRMASQPASSFATGHPRRRRFVASLLLGVAPRRLEPKPQPAMSLQQARAQKPRWRCAFLTVPNTASVQRCSVECFVVVVSDRHGDHGRGDSRRAGINTLHPCGRASQATLLIYNAPSRTPS